MTDFSSLVAIPPPSDHFYQLHFRPRHYIFYSTTLHHQHHHHVPRDHFAKFDFHADAKQITEQ